MKGYVSGGVRVLGLGRRSGNGRWGGGVNLGWGLRVGGVGGFFAFVILVLCSIRPGSYLRFMFKSCCCHHLRCLVWYIFN